MVAAMSRFPLAGLGLSLALAASLAAAPACADPPMWTVHGANGSEVTLFGSVHLLSEGSRWYGPRLAAELARANRVWFEIPLDAAAQAEAQKDAIAQGRLPPGQTLGALLSPQGRTRLAAVEAELKLPDAAVQPLRPWLAEALISVSYFLKAGARADLGVEQQIDRDAPPGAQRGALETVADQIDALSAGSQADQVASLEQTLKDVHDEPESFAKLVGYWRAGDVRGLVREELDPMRRDSPTVYRRLVLDRNKRWAGELEALLKREPGRTFVVVGVGHLIGPGSVPDLLRRDGIKVDGP